jgi:hypothetical protein
MNLHGIASSAISAVNPSIPVTVRVSAGQSDPGDNGERTPLYETPGALVGSIAAGVLTATVVSQGKLKKGQTVAGTGLPASLAVVRQLSGTAGGIGTYQLNQAVSAASLAMTTSLVLRAQVQALTWRDLQQLEGLNLGGTRRKIYLFGEVEGIARPDGKGGDLVTIAVGGVNDGEWLVAQALEQYPDWVSAAITQQNA